MSLRWITNHIPRKQLTMVSRKREKDVGFTCEVNKCDVSLTLWSYANSDDRSRLHWLTADLCHLFIVVWDHVHVSPLWTSLSPCLGVLLPRVLWILSKTKEKEKNKNKRQSPTYPYQKKRDDYNRYGQLWYVIWILWSMEWVWIYNISKQIFLYLKFWDRKSLKILRYL